MDNDIDDLIRVGDLYLKLARLEGRRAPRVIPKLLDAAYIHYKTAESLIRKRKLGMYTASASERN